MHERTQRLAEQSQRFAEQSRERLAAYAQSGAQAETAMVDPSLPQVLGRAAEDSKQLLTQEVQLAKSEMTRKAKSAGKGAGMFGAAGIAGLFALGALSAGAILALALALPAWLAAVIVGAAYLVVAAVLVVAGRSNMQEATPFMPEQTVRTLSALGGKLSRAWQRGQA